MTQRLDQEICNGMVQIARVDCQEYTDYQRNTQQPLLGARDLSVDTENSLTIQLTFGIVGACS
jgi:hypothetical protein